ncbi:MAG: hypothetical protein MZV70_74660 [Desulfobacterales bacterium]|nr:hypothetical protein [Desulfobacterales bacterium]
MKVEGENLRLKAEGSGSLPFHILQAIWQALQLTQRRVSTRTPYSTPG